MVIKNNKPIEENVEEEFKEAEEATIKEDKTIKEYVTSLFRNLREKVLTLQWDDDWYKEVKNFLGQNTMMVPQ